MVHSWLKDKEHEDFKRLGHLLGNYWTEDNLEDLFKETANKPKGNRPKEFFWPLLFVLQHNFIDVLKSVYGRKYGIAPPEFATDGSPIEEVFNWDIDKFRKFLKHNLPK